ncbi:MAG: hypothetical protein P4L53_20095 [Candidatus Obscuribacterales bacterium]|nr:hypothetical protein [Candidatus Obscuribacterales bacterium]
MTAPAMFKKNTVILLTILSILVSLSFDCALANAQSSDKGESEPTPSAQDLSVVSYVTWWSHDATGYHPAIYLRYENDSARDLSGTLIRFQCRFTDLRNGYVTVARKEMRTDLARFRQRYVIMRGPAQFELPIDENAWPNIECKAMSRIGEVGDEGTQELLLCKLDSITMTDDEALEKLNKQDDIRKGRMSAANKARKHGRGDAVADAPLSPQAPALPLNGTNANKTQSSKNGGKPTGNLDFSIKAKGPGLGDDFFDFEQAFGRPIETDPGSTKWTWAHYREPDSSDVYAGARKPGSKANVIISSVRSNKPLSDSQLSTIAHAYAGKFKSQALGNFTHTVRYLSTGRVQMTKMSAPSFHLSAYNVDNTADPTVNNYVLILSMLPVGDETSVVTEIKRSRILKFVTTMVGDLDRE